jgi:hypothetical protein
MSEIWPDKRGCLWWEWPYWSGEYCITQITMTFILIKATFSLQKEWPYKRQTTVLNKKRAGYVSLNTVKPAHVVTSIKQSPVLKGHPFLVLS